MVGVGEDVLVGGEAKRRRTPAPTAKRVPTAVPRPAPSPAPRGIALLQRPAGNAAVRVALASGRRPAGVPLVQRDKKPPARDPAAEVPATDPGTDLKAGADATPPVVAFQLGADYDATAPAAGTPATGPAATGSPATGMPITPAATGTPATATPPAAAAPPTSAPPATDEPADAGAPPAHTELPEGGVPPSSDGPSDAGAIAGAPPQTAATPAGQAGAAGGAAAAASIPAQRLDALSLADLMLALQILRVNGSVAHPGTHEALDWVTGQVASGSQKVQLGLKLLTQPGSAPTAADLKGLDDATQKSATAFSGLSSWNDATKGIPFADGGRTIAPGSDDEANVTQMAAMIKARRDVVNLVTPFAKGLKKGVEYDGHPGKDPAPDGNRLDTDWKKALWAELGGEGSGSSINTYDDQGFTWGRGYSAKSELKDVVARLFRADPAMQQELMEGGITLAGSDWLYVDVDKKQILKGTDGFKAFQNDKKFASFMARVAEDPSHRQNVSDAEWDHSASGGHALNPPVAAQSWPEASLRFGAHCVHWGYGWGEVVANGPDLTTLFTWICGKKGSDGIVGPGASTTILSFAGGAAQALVSGPVDMPAQKTAGAIYLQQRSGKVRIYPVSAVPKAPAPGEAPAAQ